MTAQSAGLEKMTLGSIVQLTDTGVRQEIDILGQVTTRFFNAVHAQADEAIRAKLIELGWTPPGAALAKPTANAAGLKQRAREFLAAEYDADDPTMAKKIREGTCRNEESNRAIPAIVAALAAAPAADGVLEYEFEVWQGDAWQAGGSCADLETAQAEANHYALMYAQDGPVTVRMYEKRAIAAAPQAQGEE